MIIKDDSLQYKLDKLNIDNGDILVLKYKDEIPMERLNKLHNELKSRINKDIFIIMMDNSVEIETLSDENLLKICKERGLIND